MTVPKIELNSWAGTVLIDAQTKPIEGGSSFKVVDTEDTEVYFGRIHARVEMRDLHIIVNMDPEEGRWSNREWARARALSILCAPETIALVLPRLIELSREAGRKLGREQLQHETCVLLGLRR